MPYSTRTLALALGLLLAACAAPREAPLQSPQLNVLVAHYAGDPIGGPLAREAAASLELSPAEALPLRGRLYVVARPYGEGFGPISEHVRLIVAGGGSEPLAPSSLLTPGASLATGEAAAALAAAVEERPATEVVLAASFEGLSLPGLTTSFSATHLEPIQIMGYRPLDRTIRIDLWRDSADQDDLALALVISDVVRVVEGLAEVEPEVSLRPREEQLMLDVRAGSEWPVVLLAPSRADLGARLAYLLVLEVGEAQAEPTEELVDRVRVVGVEVREAAAQGTERRARLVRGELERLRSLRAIEALSDPAHRRSALAELTGYAAPIAYELTITARDADVERFSERLLAEPAVLRELAESREALAWRIEREVVLMLTQALSEDSLAPEYAALLLRFTGEAGRYPGVLEDAVAASVDTDSFQRRVLEENRIALEDSSPSARLRAFDWLGANGIEVPGYDPLADRSERRAALRAWAEASAAAEAEAATANGTEAP